MRACYEYGTAGYITGVSVQVNTNGILPGFCNKDIVENITYNEFGQTAGFELGNGIETTYTYDVKGRMVRIHSSGDVGGSTKVLQDAVYSFNNKNNIVGITNATNEFNAQYDYDYDGIGRLTNAVGSYVETADNLNKRFQQSYSYAKNGNLIAKRIHDPANGAIQDEWTYQYTNHQVTNIDSSKTGTDTFTLQYDANGNLTRQRDNAKDLTKRISVDSQDRIVQIQDANNAILGSYWYDEGGFRVRRSALEPKNNQFTNVEILYPSKFYGLEYIESENVITSVNNVYLNGVRIAALNEAGALAYFLTDQVDSVSHVLDDEGNTLSKMQYLPYGDTFIHKGDTNFAPKYNSQELDRESGFYFYNARYYDPGIARFTSADTVIDDEWDTQGWNRFSYVKGNPIGAKDPTGHNAVGGIDGSQVSAGMQEATKELVSNLPIAVATAFICPPCAVALGIYGFIQLTHENHELQMIEMTGKDSSGRPVSKEEFSNRTGKQTIGIIATVVTSVAATKFAKGGSSSTASKSSSTTNPTVSNGGGGPKTSKTFTKSDAGYNTGGRTGIGNGNGCQCTPVNGKTNNFSLKDGDSLSTSKALDYASKHLGPRYKEISPGVFKSKDGTKLVRMTNSDLSKINNHAGAPHLNFETGRSVIKPNGKETFISAENKHIYLPEEF